MNDDRRLKDKLARLAAEGDGRPIPGDDPLRAILHEIDETILPRRLAFRAADGAVLVLKVANRRLLAILDLPADLAGGDDRARLQSPLTPDDAGALSAVAGALARFARQHGAARVTTEPLDRTLDPSGIGRTAPAIAEALGFDLYDPPTAVAAPDPAQGFVPGLRAIALAVARVEGGAAARATGPDAEAVRRLSGLDRAAIDALLARLGRGPQAGGRFLLLAGEGEALFLGQTDAGHAVAALVPAAHAGTVVALWQATRDA